MPKAWISSLAVGAVLAVAPLKPLTAQNPNNELFLQTFMSNSVASILTQIFVPNVTFAAGTGFDIRQFNGTTLGPSLFYRVASTSMVNGNLTISPDLLLAANTMYAIVLETGPNSSPALNASLNTAFAGGSIYSRSSSSSAWVNQNQDVAGFSVTMVAAPEPATVGLMATGLFGLAGVGFRRRNRQI